MILQVKDLSVRYGGIRAVNNLNLEVDEREIVTLIGANGAGKSSTLHAISGVLNGTGVEGEVIFNGNNVIKEKCNARAKMGIV